MGAPLIGPMIATSETTVPSLSGGGDPADGAAFGTMLGVALAAAAPAPVFFGNGTTPPPESLVARLIDGAWVTEPSLLEAGNPEALDPDPARVLYHGGPAADALLERGLDGWLSRLGGRVDYAGRAQPQGQLANHDANADAGEAEPHRFVATSRLPASPAARVRPLEPIARADRATVLMSVPATDLAVLSGLLGPRNPEAPSGDPQTALVVTEPVIRAAVERAPRRPPANEDETVAATDLIGRRSSNHGVEIAGFEFPVPLAGFDSPVLLTRSDVPVPLTRSDLPVPLTHSDLPVPLTRSDLPVPFTRSDLPVPLPRSDLPGPFTSSDLPGPFTRSDLPAPLTRLEVPGPVAGFAFPVPLQGTREPIPQLAPLPTVTDSVSPILDPAAAVHLLEVGSGAVRDAVLRQPARRAVLPEPEVTGFDGRSPSAPRQSSIAPLAAPRDDGRSGGAGHQRESPPEQPNGEPARRRLVPSYLVDSGPAAWSSVPNTPPPSLPTDGRSVGDPEGVAPAAAEPKPNSRLGDLVLQLGDDQGEIGRLRVAVHGPNVRATIIPNDQAMADQLTVNLRELRQSLQERGFPEPRITVQPPRVLEAVLGPTVARDLIADAAGAKPLSRSMPDHQRNDRAGDSHPDRRHQSPDRPRQQRHQKERPQ